MKTRQAISPETNLNRPTGYFPRGTSLGIVGLAMLLVGVPFIGLECAAPFFAKGVDRWLASAPYIWGGSVVVTLVVVFSAVSHHYWSVCFFFYTGWALLIAYALSIVFALAAVAHVFPVLEPGLEAMPIVGLILLLVLGLGAWFLLRALRLRYWQPGSTPDQWEPGDEGPPAWAMSNARKP